jgi:drug/metabolite transporter (DMT)-like permease
MFFLIATILLNTVLFIFFKVFPKYKIDTLQAIVANYCTCAVTGSLLLGHYPVTTASVEYAWLPWALLMGAMFISIFNLLAYCTIKDGITTTTIANKLSLVIPVVFSVFLYNETLDAMKIAGILIALPAVYFTTRVPEEGKKGQNIVLPALLFIASGLLDTLVKYVENRFIQDTNTLLVYTVHVFTTASIIGLILVTVQVLRGKMQLRLRNIVAGVLLGVPNYFSIYYLVKLLNSGFMQSSAAIPVNNIGIVVVCAIVAILLFKEKANAMRLIGLVLSIIAIVLIAYKDLNAGSI